MIYARLALVFTILSVLGFGGGNAIIPQMHHDVVERFHWVTSQQFSQDFALARLAPGPTTTMSALIGYSVAGVPGAVVATAGVLALASAASAMTTRAEASSRVASSVRSSFNNRAMGASVRPCSTSVESTTENAVNTTVSR